MPEEKFSDNVIYDKWLSAILKQDVYKIVVDGLFIENKGKNIIKHLQKKEGFLYSKIPVEAIHKIEFIEELDFNLIDTNVVLKKAVSSYYDPKSDLSLRFASCGDHDRVVELSRKGFAFSRFHLDKKFPIEIANTIKAEWAKSFFSGHRGICMVVAEIDNRIAGFLQLLKKDFSTLVIDLVAVDSDFRCRGVGSDMISYAEKYCRGYDYIEVGTQLANLPSLNLYEKMGFKIKESFYIFHYHCFR